MQGLPGRATTVPRAVIPYAFGSFLHPDRPRHRHRPADGMMRSNSPCAQGERWAGARDRADLQRQRGDGHKQGTTADPKPIQKGQQPVERLVVHREDFAGVVSIPSVATRFAFLRPWLIAPVISSDCRWYSSAMSSREAFKCPWNSTAERPRARVATESK